jgi:hypothetical protein
MPIDRDFDFLVQRYMDGIAAAEEIQALNARLRDDEQARMRFAEILNLDSALADVASGLEFAEEPIYQADIKPRRYGLPLLTAKRACALAACLGVIIAGAWWWHATQAFATVLSVAGVEGLAPETALRGELYQVNTGLVELITARGAHVVIEAPAEFRFESAQRLKMIRGRLAADVPPSAKGFTVITPSGDAIDLGTRFGVDVPREGAPEIHVFQGEVIAQPSGATATQSLHRGDAMTLKDGTGTSRELRSAAFILPDEMLRLTAGLASGQQVRSDAALVALQQDPALIALFDFEADAPYAGVFRTVQGRWPGSHAVEFVNVGDHLKLNVGGDRSWPHLTLAAWVRIDRLGEPYQSLLHTDGWSENNAGQLHWMINRDTTMRLALFGNTLAPGSDEQHGFPDSRTPVLNEQGRWVHLAVVYDANLRTVRFYLNGQFDKETQQEIAHPARLGPAQIGNWNQRDRKLSGRIDELVILGRALGDDELRSAYTAGNPYR